MSWAATPAAPAPTATAPKARLRGAGMNDLDALCAVYRAARGGAGGDADETADEMAAEMAAWLEHGGAILLESEGAPIAAARWREEAGGWRVDPATGPYAERGQGFERWLMTKVEALAIRANVPTLTVALPTPEALPTFRRMGYRRRDGDDGNGDGNGDAADASGPTLVKRVGGMWQVQAPSADEGLGGDR